jgi:hypothetical protein
MSQWSKTFDMRGTNLSMFPNHVCPQQCWRNFYALTNGGSGDWDRTDDLRIYNP